jgi:hypothetical protein
MGGVRHVEMRVEICVHSGASFLKVDSFFAEQMA